MFDGPFGARAVTSLRPTIEAHVDRLLAGLERADGPIDVVAALAEPLPLTVILDVVGLPAGDAAQVRRWADALIANDDPDVLVDERERACAAAAATEFGRYVSRHAIRRARDGGDDLLAAVVAAHEADRIGLPDAVVNIMFVVVAALETTTGLIANGVAALLSQPSTRARLREEPGLSRPVLDELLRFDSPIQ